MRTPWLSALRRSWWVPFLFLVAAALPGCSCDSSIGRGCRSSSECGPGMACSGGRCVLRPDGSTIEDDAPLADGETLGFDGAACARSSDAVATQPVDIIVMVDQSASTGEERDAIEANINTNLVSVLEANHLDYHVILINSDPELCPDPPLREPGSDCMSSGPRYLRVPHPVNNSDELTLLLWTYVGDGKRPNSCVRQVGTVPAWRDFLRPEALKVFLVFSDDDPTTYRASGAPAHCGGGGAFAGCSSATCPALDCDAVDWGSVCPNFGCPTFDSGPADWAGGRDFLTELYDLDPPGMFGDPVDDPRVVFHSLIGVPRILEPSEPMVDRCDTCSSGGNTAENTGPTYQAISIATGGLRFPSCNTDYSVVFERIADRLLPLACEYVVEVDPGTTLDPTLVNVLFDHGDGSDPELIRADPRRACADASGWQWNEDFTRIRLCGSACARVRAAEAGSVSISVGCATVEVPF